MIEYIINKRDFIQCDADIILSGCIDILPPPKLYYSEDVVFWVYPSIEQPLNLKHYTTKNLEEARNKVTEYLLDPDRVVFHPSRIEEEKSKFLYHYIPSKKPNVLYHSEDLAVHLNSEWKSYQTIPEDYVKKGDKNTIGLYFKEEERYEKLLLKQNVIGRTIKCNILVDFDGIATIDKQGLLSTTSAVVKVNGSEVNQTIQLKKGDEIRFGDTSALYW